MKPPVISVILPVYNGEKFLRQAIDSILDQTFGDFELIIINDGSTDSTEAIILSYVDKRIVYEKNENNLRLIKTLNKGVLMATGQYIARMDADDISLPWRFQKQLDVLRDGNYDLVSSSDIKINNDGRYIGSGSCFPAGEMEAIFLLMVTNPINHPTVLCDSRLLKRFMYSDSLNAINIEDYDLWMRLSFAEVRFALIEEPLLLYRRSDSNITAIHLDSLLRSTRSVAEKIQEFNLGSVGNKRFFDIFVLREAEEGFFGVLGASFELWRLFRAYIQKNPSTNILLMNDWMNYLLIQSIMRLKAGLFFRVACLIVFPRSVFRYMFLKLSWRLKYAHLVRGV